MRNRELMTGAIFVLMLAVAAVAADRANLTFTFFRVAVPGAVHTDPRGINDAGVIVGAYGDANLRIHGFALDGENLTTLDDPNGNTTICEKINKSGAIVGRYTIPGVGPVGFLYQQGAFTDITGPAGATGASAFGINDKEEIVGFYLDSAGLEHGFLLQNTTYTTLDVPGASATAASSINNRGDIVLVWLNSKTGAIESSLYDGKTYRTINVPGAMGSVALGNDNLDDVVYQWNDATNLLHAALRHNGKFYKIKFPHSLQTYASGINNGGVIVGGYQSRKNGPFHGYKAIYK